MKSLWQAFWSDESGQGLVEYALIIALDGWITVSSPTRDEALGLHPGSVAALAADVQQTITAQEDSAFLTVLSC